VIFYNIK